MTGSGENFKVNGTATVICGNVQTANATVYIIDKVLMPKARFPSAASSVHEGSVRSSRTEPS